jgi:hypothetical protein
LASLARPRWKRKIEQSSEPFDVSIRRGAAREHEDTPHLSRTPSLPIEDDRGRQALLCVEPSHGLLDGSKRSLDFDHQRCGRRNVVGEQVDRSALAVPRVRHLRFNCPAMPLEDRAEAAGEQRMLLIKEAIQRGSVPEGRDAHRRPQCFEYSPEGLDGHAMHVSTLKA